MKILKDVAEFHERFGLEYSGKPRRLPRELGNFRELFMLEELSEYRQVTQSDAETPEDITQLLEEALDALVDLVYVAVGTAYLHGFNFEEAWNRVHQANMAKVRVEKPGDSKRGSTYDVVKPPGWKPPRHVDLVEDHAHRGEKA